VVPFVVGGRTVGVLSLENCNQAQAFSKDDLSFALLLAKYTALAVDNARLSRATSAGPGLRHDELDIWRDLCERLPVGVLFVSPQRRYVWANSTFCRMTGFRQEELEGDWGKTSSLFPQDLGSLCLESTGTPQELSLVHQDSSQCPVMAAFWDMKTTGTPHWEGHLGILVDQTERVDLEQKLLHMQRLSDLGALLSTVSHELNNPLTAVIGFAELMLAREDIPLESREDLTTIVIQAERSVSVVRDLLDYAHFQDEGPTQIDINHVIRQLVRFRTRSLKEDALEIILELADGLPPLLGHARQLQQVMLNLTNNAEQAIACLDEGGKLWIRTSLVDGNTRVRISVRDDGPGIPVEIESRIFEPFFTTKRSGQGTGLGLSISKQIVERHEGCISLENEPGKGATFLIDLPVPSTCEPNRDDDPAAFAQQADVPPARILVIDDEETIGCLLVKILSKQGHLVDVAYSGSKAIRRLRETPYDIVFLDIKIPSLSGQAVYTWIKKDRAELARRTVILTGDTFNSETIAFLNKEHVPLLPKPFQLADLQRVMTEIWPN